jgi:hypothetical protein
MTYMVRILDRLLPVETSVTIYWVNYGLLRSTNYGGTRSWTGGEKMLIPSELQPFARIQSVFRNLMSRHARRRKNLEILKCQNP